MSERDRPATEAEAERMLAALLPEFAGMSLRYEQYALRFTCRETLRNASYSWRRGEATSERIRAFDYLLVFNENRSRYDVLRETYDKYGRPSGNSVELDLRAPDAYAWTFLFNARNQRVLNFRYLGREIKDFRLTHVVEFQSSVPYVEGHDTREWSGLAWIEDRSFNLVRIEARPSFQERRLSGQWRVYTESWNLPWGKSKPRPKGQEITVEFHYTRESVLFPTRVELRQFVWVARGRDVTDRRIVLDYTDYRFFQTEAEVVGEPSAERP